MRTPLLVLCAALAILFLAAPAQAAPPAGYECIGGYNPAALTNVCYKVTSGSQPYNTGTVTTSPYEVCIIGNLCEEVPYPTYSSSGGTTVSVPTVSGELYHEVLGSPTVTECQNHAGGTAVVLLIELMCGYTTDFSGRPAFCATTMEGPGVCLVDGPYDGCVYVYVTGTNFLPACYDTGLESENVCTSFGRATSVGICYGPNGWGQRCAWIYGTVDQELTCL